MTTEWLERLLAAVPGVLMLSNGLSLLVDPAGATRSLGMPLLDGVGRSTQLGDLTALFIATAIFVFTGAWRRNALWLCAAAVILSLAATFRVLAFLLHGAPFAAVFIAAEVVMAAWLFVFAWRFRQDATA